MTAEILFAIMDALILLAIMGAFGVFGGRR